MAHSVPVSADDAHRAVYARRMTGGSGRRRAASALAAWSPRCCCVLPDAVARLRVESGCRPPPSLVGSGQHHERSSPHRADFRPRSRALLARQARAVLHHDEPAFLATVDHRQPALLQQQRTLYDNITQLPLASLGYGVDTSAALVPADVPGDDPLLHPAVVEHLKLAGTFDRPVSNPVDETFVRRHGHWLLGSESEAKEADHFDTPQERPWFGVPDRRAARRPDDGAGRPVPGRQPRRPDHGGPGRHRLRRAGCSAYRRRRRSSSTPPRTALSLNFSAPSARRRRPRSPSASPSTDALGEQDTGLAGLRDQGQPPHRRPGGQRRGDHAARADPLPAGARTTAAAPEVALARASRPGCSTTPTTSPRWQVPADLYDRLMRADHDAADHRSVQRGPVAQLPDLPGGRAWLVAHYGVAKLLDLMRAYRARLHRTPTSTP